MFSLIFIFICFTINYCSVGNEDRHRCCAIERRSLTRKYIYSLSFDHNFRGFIDDPKMAGRLFFISSTWGMKKRWQWKKLPFFHRDRPFIVLQGLKGSLSTLSVLLWKGEGEKTQKNNRSGKYRLTFSPTASSFYLSVPFFLLLRCEIQIIRQKPFFFNFHFRRLRLSFPFLLVYSWTSLIALFLLLSLSSTYSHLFLRFLLLRLSIWTPSIAAPFPVRPLLSFSLVHFTRKCPWQQKQQLHELVR